MDDEEIIKIQGAGQFKFKDLKNCNINEHLIKDLPSNHPYWFIEVMKDNGKKYNKIKLLYEECKIDPDKIKYHFNSSTSLNNIEEKLKKYEYSVNILQKLNINYERRNNNIKWCQFQN